jgi:hypothetical protein
MSPESSLPNLARDLVRIHRAISRGLSVSEARGAQFTREGFPDARLRRGFFSYVQALTIVLGAHHLGEDEIAFPALRPKLPAAPYERLAADHHAIDTALAEVRGAMSDMAGDGAKSGLSVLVEGIRRVSAVWPPHIQLEEQHFAEGAIGAVMTPDEQAQVSVSMAKHSQEHALPPFLALPFVLFNLAAEDRASMAESLPKVITEQLVPKEWKDQWSPMKPFLLD